LASARTPSAFFLAALDILEEDGFTSLTAVSLCDRVGVTRGSFYHHFLGFDDFVDRLLAYWQERYTIEAATSVEHVEDEQIQYERQRFLAEHLPHGAEAAIRAWSLVDDRVAAAQKRVDDYRLAWTASYLRRHGLSAADAQVYADLAVSSLIGLQMLDRPVDPARVRRVIAAVQDRIEQRVTGPRRRKSGGSVERLHHRTSPSAAARAVTGLSGSTN
jgi:AcrR family transcriptional regulator